jgi:hypothetical protein
MTTAEKAWASSNISLDNSTLLQSHEGYDFLSPVGKKGEKAPSIGSCEGNQPEETTSELASRPRQRHQSAQRPYLELASLAPHVHCGHI